MTNYLLAGGGTAGHVNPLLALAETIKRNEPDAQVLILGTAEGLEARLVPQRGFTLLTIPKLPFPRRISNYLITFPARYQAAVKQVQQLLQQHRIDVVVGFGGYAAAPAYSAAKRAKIPLVLHEANALPGLANRLGARYTQHVGVAFANTPLPNAQVVGMPLRQEIATLNPQQQRTNARAFFGLDANKPTLLVTGGSLGANAINQAVLAGAAQIVATGAQILHIWGGSGQYSQNQIPGYQIIEYCDRMDLAFAACDLVLSRAGSATVSEIAGLGIPAIFVPYSHGNGEQAHNCRQLVAVGAALLTQDSELNQNWVTNELLSLLTDPQRLLDMHNAALSVGYLDGDMRLYALVQQALKK